MGRFGETSKDWTVFQGQLLWAWGARGGKGESSGMKPQGWEEVLWAPPRGPAVQPAVGLEGEGVGDHSHSVHPLIPPGVPVRGQVDASVGVGGTESVERVDPEGTEVLCRTAATDASSTCHSSLRTRQCLQAVLCWP